MQGDRVFSPRRKATSKTLIDADPQNFDYVITVRDSVAEACLLNSGKTTLPASPFVDPPAAA